MIQRIALLIASLAAAGVLAVALAAAGFAPVPRQTAEPLVAEAIALSTPDPTPAPTASPRVQIDTVYVKPAPPPKVVHVVKKVKAKATPAPVAPTRQPVVVISSASKGGENDGQEGGD